MISFSQYFFYIKEKLIIIFILYILGVFSYKKETITNFQNKIYSFTKIEAIFNQSQMNE